MSIVVMLSDVLLILHYMFVAHFALYVCVAKHLLNVFYGFML